MNHYLFGPGEKTNEAKQQEELEILEAFQEAENYLEGIEDDSDMFFDTLD